MVKKLVEKGIKDEKVLEAIAKTPRHSFMDASFEDWAYIDKAFKIGRGQTISQPYTLAYQSQLLNVQKGDKIMEIGTGSGYQAAVLANMGAKVFTVERIKSLHLGAKKRMQLFNLKNVQLFYGDGIEGLPLFAPFDKILITAAVKKMPEKILDQLKNNGFLVAPMGQPVQTMVRIQKIEQNYNIEKFDTFSFVPLLKGTVD